jgi:hypothetical protein
VTPLGHLAVSVLLARVAGLDDRRAFALVLAGAVLPDLVDKPLAAVGAVPVAHTVGHSVVVLAGAALAVAGVARLRPAAPLVVGWAGHVAADLVVAYPRFLVNYAWPLVAPRPTPDGSAVAYWVEYALGPLGALELLLAAGAALTLRRAGPPS